MLFITGGNNLKAEQLEKLKNDYILFFNKYFNQEIPLIFGSGNLYSKLVLVGEAPGKQEIIQGKPFVGQAGKNLDEFINILEIQREDLYITNIVKFRPFKINPDTGREANRPPTKEEVNISADFIKRELIILEPKLIVSLGNVALKCILDDESAAIGRFHGNPISFKLQNIDYTLFPLYHPASVIYNRSLHEVYLSDLHKLKQYLEANASLVD